MTDLNMANSSDVSCALYGLGDSSYEKFCYAGKMLGRRLAGLGAEMLGEPMWGDERAPNGWAASCRVSNKLTTQNRRHIRALVATNP